jgi:hypothetical protein
MAFHGGHQEWLRPEPLEMINDGLYYGRVVCNGMAPTGNRYGITGFYLAPYADFAEFGLNGRSNIVNLRTVQLLL